MWNKFTCQPLGTGHIVYEILPPRLQYFLRYKPQLLSDVHSRLFPYGSCQDDKLDFPLACWLRVTVHALAAWWRARHHLSTTWDIPTDSLQSPLERPLNDSCHSVFWVTLPGFPQIVEAYWTIRVSQTLFPPTLWRGEQTTCERKVVRYAC